MQDITVTAKIMMMFNNDADIKSLNDTAEQYRLACNYASQYIYDNNFEFSTIKLNKVIYRDLRSMFNLKSQMAQSVLRTVVARYRTTKTQLRKKPYRYKDANDTWKTIYRDLSWLQKPIYFGRKQLDLVANRDWSYSIDKNILSVNTINGRIKTTPNIKGFEKYMDGTWSLGLAKIVPLNNHWYFHVSVTKQHEVFLKEHVQNVIGIDRGLRFLATTYDSQNKTTFFDGKSIMRKRDKYKALRASLQAKGTKSAKRRLRKLSKRENRWMSDVNHQISKTLIDKYGKNSLFVMENLSNVRFNTNELSKNMRGKVSSWAFGQFEQFLTYKAELNESSVIEVSAQYTSQRCPRCGTIDKENRDHNNHLYTCKNCGYRSNDDRIGAMNIQELGRNYISGIEKPRFIKQQTEE